MSLPVATHFADLLLDAAHGLPTGRGYRFTPTPRSADSPVNPRDPHHDGVSSDLTVGEHRFATALPTGETYCCGVTLEAFWRAWTVWCASTGRPPEVPGLDAAGHDRLVTTWFCPTMGHPGAALAIVDLGLGVRVAPEDALPGDFCQFWRSTDLARPSGHSVIFLGWGERGGVPTIRYWSSQPATDGIGEHTEAVGPDWTFAFARVGRPAHGA